MGQAQILKRGLIFIISGPSGSGKTTLLKNLIKTPQLKRRLIRSISFTTRPKRSSEKDKEDYFFISEKQFKEKLKAKKILERTKYIGYYYATPRDFIERQLMSGRHIILCLDFRGALTIKRFYPKNTVTIFVIPPSLGALRGRIKKRCHKTKQEEIRKRLRLAQQEMKAHPKYDYCVVNKELAKTTKELKGIILNKINAANLVPRQRNSYEFNLQC